MDRVVTFRFDYRWKTEYEEELSISNQSRSQKKAPTPRFFLTSSHEGSNSKNWFTSEHLKQATDIQKLAQM